MPQKHVAVTLRRGPIATNGCVEGLRAAVGLTAGTEENTVTCVFLGDAVVFALRESDRDEARKHVDTLAGMNAPLLVDESALTERGLEAADVIAPFRVVSRLEIVAALRDVDAALGF